VGRLLEEASVGGVGVLRAFEGGLVKARFADNTLLHLDQRLGICRLLTHDAVSVSLPVPPPSADAQTSPDAALYRRYVRPALDFAQWAVLTPQQRVQAYSTAVHMRGRVEQDLLRARAHLICGGAAPPATQAPAGGSAVVGRRAPAEVAAEAKERNKRWLESNRALLSGAGSRG
jgi:hypothetical protein